MPSRLSARKPLTTAAPKLNPPQEMHGPSLKPPTTNPKLLCIAAIDVQRGDRRAPRRIASTELKLPAELHEVDGLWEVVKQGVVIVPA